MLALSPQALLATRTAGLESPSAPGPEAQTARRPFCLFSFSPDAAGWVEPTVGHGQGRGQREKPSARSVLWPAREEALVPAWAAPAVPSSGRQARPAFLPGLPGQEAQAAPAVPAAPVVPAARPVPLPDPGAPVVPAAHGPPLPDPGAPVVPAARSAL